MTNKIERPIQLKGGHSADDPRLGRVPEFDERSRQYDLAELTTYLSLRGKSWPLKLRLDQLQTSACTGNARTYDLAASPVPLKKPDGTPFDEDYAQALYRLAQKLDEWPGENYEGSSVLGALKAAQKLGFIGEYRWAFNIDDWVTAIAHIGGSVVGTVWLDGMFDPRPNGLLEVMGKEAGGHSYFFRRIIVSKDVKRRVLGKGETIRDVPLLGGTNSWGESWGVGGDFYMWVDDYQDHLWDGGEQSVVTTAFHR